MTVAFLDGDIIAFKAAAVSQDVFEMNGQTLTAADMEQAIKTADYLVEQWRSKAKAQKVYMCLTGTANFRKLVDPEYKAQRPTAKPVNLVPLKQYLFETYNGLMIEGLEADDLMGLYAMDPAYGQTVIVSTDKDMQCIPGMLLNPDKQSRPVKISKAMANRYWFTQTLTGDPVDNFKGAPGIGPKKAEAIINSASSFGDCWEKVVEAFEAQGLTEADALRNARCARILRRGEFNFQTNEVHLWHPTRPKTLSLDRLTTGQEQSKPSTTSTRSQPTTEANTPSRQQTSSSTSVALPSRARSSGTSRKPDGTSTGSSPKSKKRKRKPTTNP